MPKLIDVERMLKWLQAEGGYIHPSAVVREDEHSGGLGLFTTKEVAADERLISCPFSCAVTPAVALEAISALYGLTEAELVVDGKKWDERMLISAYVALHWVWTENQKEWPAQLRHRAYVDSLPDAEELTTPMFFNEDELRLLEGTNLYGAVVDQKRKWEAEAESVRSLLKEDGMTLNRYRTVQTYLSSRAFPSSLLRLPDGETSTATDAESHPVLLPGLDLLNHARGVPILWLSSKVKSPVGDVPAISFVAPSSIAADAEVFNNYGAKSNESLLMGYGFVITENPDDSVVLRLGGAPESAAATLKAKGLDATTRFTIGRDGQIPQQLLEIMRIIVGQDSDDEDSDDEHAVHEYEIEALETELNVLEMLQAMLESKVDGIAGSTERGEGVRDSVAKMVEVYRQGQVDIINKTLETVRERVQRVEGLLDDGPECPCGC